MAFNSIPDAIKKWESSHGYTESQAAEAAGIPRSSWQRYKNKSGVRPTGNNLIMLADALNIPAKDVMVMANTSHDTKKDPPDGE